jgi:PAS domain S-box-containing protein
LRAGFLEQIEDAIVAMDPDWRVVVWNEAAERMYGWSATEAVGRNASEVARLDLSDDRRAEIRLDTRDRGRWQGEVAAFRKDGTRFEIELTALEITGGHGALVGFAEIHRDVNARKRAEKELRDAQRRIENILESITDSFSALDREWRYTYLNQHALDRIAQTEGRAVTLDELVGKSVWEAFPALVGTTIDHELHRALREQKTVTFETHHAATDEWLEVAAYPLNDGGLLVYGRDITDRKRDESELRYHASLLDNVEDGVIATAAEEFRVTAWNRGAERLYGFKAEEVLGRPSREVATYPGDESQRELERELTEAGRTRTEFTARRKDGTPVDVELIAVAVQGDRGEISGYLGIHRDITERKRTEQWLIEAREAERNRIARALHDEALQTLADALMLAMAVRSASPESAPAGQLVPVVQRVFEQLRGAIYDLRLGAEEHHAFPELLKELVEVHGEMAVDSEIELDVGEGVPTGPLGVTGLEVLRIVGEALTNARQHADARHVRVRVWRRKASLWVEVADDGRGFEPNGAAFPMHHGIRGMRERAKLLGGHLEIRSEPGVGTTVRLEAIVPE